VSTYLVVLDGAEAEDEVLTTLATVVEDDFAANFTLLVPADRRRFATEGECWLEAAQRANDALETLKAFGFDVTEAVVGDFMRRKAISEELRRSERAYDEIILFTLPYMRGLEVSHVVGGDIARQLRHRHCLPVRQVMVDASEITPEWLLMPRMRDLQLASLSRRN
jgi:hypothetical protein